MIGRYFPLSKAEPWKNSAWRKVARIVLGELAPSTDDLYFPEIHDDCNKAANEIADPTEKLKRLARCNDVYGPLARADNEWFWWHSILLKRFPKLVGDDAARHTLAYLLTALFSTGLVLLVLCAFAPKVHWSLRMIAILATLAGWLGDITPNIAVLLQGSDDPHGIDLAARLLQFLDQRPTKPPIE